jgi:putative zinc finger/helix-turn-helix YgiT family protein
MICLRCDNDKFVAAPDAVIEQEFKGDTLKVQTPALACCNCGWIALDADHADELRKRTADAYRKKHGLLTGEEIKALRKLLQKNQTQFAQFVGVGEASVKRWETWLVQDKSSDELIRLKCAQALRNRLGQTPATVWITFGYSMKPRHNGIRTFDLTGAAQTPTLPADRWKLPAQPAEPANQEDLLAEEFDEDAPAPLARAA